MQIRAPMIVHSSSMSQGGPFGGTDGDGKIWYTLTSPPKEMSPLEREQMYDPPETTINMSIDHDVSMFFPKVGSNVNVTITVED